MLLSLKKSKQKNTKNSNKTNKQKQQQHIIAPVHITVGDALRHLP